MRLRRKSRATVRSYRKAVGRQRGGNVPPAADNLPLPDECPSAHVDNERSTLALAECESRFGSLFREYEQMYISRSWQYTAPLRTLLDKVLKFRRRLGRLAFSSGPLGRLLPRGSGDWLARAHGFTGRLAIVHGDLNSPPCSQATTQLAAYLAANGYLVIFAYLHDAGSPMPVHPSGVDGAIVMVPMTELVTHASHLSPLGGGGLCFIAAPSPPMVALMPGLRSAGFTLVVEISQDWQACQEDGGASWYAPDAEAQAVLSADLVVVQAALQQRFSPLRRDLVTYDHGGDDPQEEGRCAHLLRLAHAPLPMRDVYA